MIRKYLLRYVLIKKGYNRRLGTQIKIEKNTSNHQDTIKIKNKRQFEIQENIWKQLNLYLNNGILIGEK